MNDVPARRWFRDNFADYIGPDVAVALRQRMELPPEVLYGGEDESVPAVYGWSLELSELRKGARK